MPAPPEVPQRRRGVRRVEVLREREAEQQRDADRDVRVAGEVGVDLDGVRVDADQDLQRRVVSRRREDLVHDRRRQVVRDHHLLEQPGGDQVEGAARIDPSRVARALQLRDQLRRAHDRPRDEVREERQVRGELLEGRRDDVAAVGVHDVADSHERVEGDPDRQDDRLDRERQVEADDRGCVLRRRQEEVVVLEVAEQEQVPCQGDCEQPLPLRRDAGLVNPHREELVPDGAAGEEKDEAPVPPAVEDVAGDDHEPAPAVDVRHREPRERQHDDEEDREGGGREQHGGSA